MPRRNGKFHSRFNDVTWYRSNVPCMEACPVHTDSGRYVQLIAEGRFEEAYFVARSPNPLASVCGRVCAAPCEDACRRGAIDEPVTIRPLKRFVTERHGAESARIAIRGLHRAPATGRRNRNRCDRAIDARDWRGCRSHSRQQ